MRQALVVGLAIALGGCVICPKYRMQKKATTLWDARVASHTFTYGQAILERGAPAQVVRLDGGRFVGVWVIDHGEKADLGQPFEAFNAGYQRREAAPPKHMPHAVEQIRLAFDENGILTEYRWDYR